MNDQDRIVIDARDMPGAPAHVRNQAPAIPTREETAGSLPEFGPRQRLDFDNSPLPMRIFDPATLEYLAVNDAAVQLYGYSRAEFLALTLRDTRHPDEHAEQLANLGLREGYLMHRGPRRQVRKSGDVFTADVVSQDVLFEGRRARVSLTIDLTERIRAFELACQRERELETLAEEARRQKNLFAAVIDNLPMGVFIRDAQTGRYVLRNRFCENANGYRVASSVGLTPHDLFPKEQADLTVATDRQAVDSGRMIEVDEQEMMGRSGEPRTFHVRKVPLFGDDGRPWMVVGIADDVTERKQADEELRRQQKLLAAIVENLPLGIFIKDAEKLRLLMANRSANVMIKYPDKSAIGKSPHELFPEAQADQFSRTDREALESGRMVEIPEQEVRGRSGGTRIQHVRKVPLFDENGKPWVVVGIADDITERKQVESALRESNEFLRSVIESSRDCIKVLDLEGRLLSISAGGQRLMEMADASPLLGRCYLDFWGGAERDEAQAALAAARAGDAARFEGYCPTALGNPRWWDEIVTPILDKNGKPEKLLVVSRDVTEHKRAEQTLRDSEARLALAVESTGLGMWDWNVRTGEVWRHPLWARVLGYEPDDIAPHIRMWKELCHPHDYPLAQEILRAHFEGKTPVYRADYRMRHKRGSWIWTGCRAKVIEREDDGTPRRMIGYIRDISDRRTMEEALRESQQQFRAVTETANEAIVSADGSGRIIYLNQSAARLFGYRVEEAIGEPLTILMPKRFRAAHEKGLKRILDGHPSSLAGRTMEFFGLRRDGTEFPIELSLARWATNAGTFFTGIMRDISTRKHRQSLESALAAIVNNSADAIISTDLNGVVRTWNPGAERLFGYTAQETIGQSIAILLPPELHDEEALLLGRVRRGERVEAFESVRCKKTGARVEVSLTVSPVRDIAGTVVGASTIVRDITARRQAELSAQRSAALTQLLESLARAANEAMTPEAAMEACLARICKHGGWVLGRVALFERQRALEVPPRSLWYAPERSRFAEFIDATNGRVHRLSGAFIGRVFRERAPVWIEDMQAFAGFRRGNLARTNGIRAGFAFPIVVRDEVRAVMEVFALEARPADPLVMEALQAIASQLARLIERAAAQESTNRMAAIVESSEDTIVSRSPDGTILTWNPAAERLFGYPASEAVGHHYSLIVPPELLQESEARQGLIEEGRTIPAVETLRMAKDGRRIHVSLRASPIRAENGEVRAVSVIVRDISQEKKSERALRESEERFRQLAENIREVFWINTRAGDNLVYVSPAYEEIWGRSCESLYRNPRGWMEPIHPEDLPALEASQKKMAGGELSDIEYRIIRPDGTVRWIRDRSYPMSQGEGTPLVCGIAEDITSRKRVEEERITHAFHQRDALVREVHHRIKNHLQGIAGLLRNRASDDPAAAPTIEAAVAQLQSVAVVYGLQSELAESGVPLRRMLEAICASAEGLSTARIVRRFAAAGGRIRLAETEAVPVAVALNELVFNAIEHGKRRAGSPAIEIALKESRNGAEIRIVNRGTLPARFDYKRGIGTGTGLDLVRTLLGPAGSALAYGTRDGRVETTLSLKEPLVAPRKPAARKRVVPA